MQAYILNRFVDVLSCQGRFGQLLMNESPILGVIYCVWKVNCGVAKSGEVKRLKILIPEGFWQIL